MAQAIEYKCPRCGGIVEFDSTLQKMKCPYCDSIYEISDFESNDAGLDAQAADELNQSESGPAGETYSQSEAEGLGMYKCSSCGAEIIADATTASTHCPYCGNPIVLTGRVAGEVKPDLVIPFQIDKNAAIEGLKKHLTGKKLLPKVFKDENHIDEIKAIYVPFWLFDSKVKSTGEFKMERVRIWSDSRFNYTETTVYHAHREGVMQFDRVPVDGAQKIPDDLMESLEPYDSSQAVDFKTAYLAGYFADRYDVSAADSESRALKRIANTAVDAIRGSVTGYNTVSTLSSDVRKLSGSHKYALYPVWILNTSWNGQTYTFAMNGQTGKFVGNLPMDKGLYAKRLFAIGGVLSAVFYALFMFFGGM